MIVHINENIILNDKFNLYYIFFNFLSYPSINIDRLGEVKNFYPNLKISIAISVNPISFIQIQKKNVLYAIKLVKLATVRYNYHVYPAILNRIGT